MPRTAKAWISPEVWERLSNGETVTVRVPPNVSELRLSRHKYDGNDIFSEIFDGLFGRLFRRLKTF
jgi:hypothetical protein